LSEMALNLGPNVKGFVSLPKPHVWLYGSASDARGVPFASVSELAVSQHNYVVIIKFARVQGGETRSEMALNLGPNVERFVSLPKPHVWLYGSASDARGLPLASVSELAASQHNYVVIIKFARVQGGENPVDWKTRRLSRISETELKIEVEKLSSSLARQAALAEAALMETAIAEEADSPSVNSTTSVDVNEVGSSGVN
nr:hypothetical protein [Tanacetum cinerariifolium]